MTLAQAAPSQEARRVTPSNRASICASASSPCSGPLGPLPLKGIDWVIVGGESGRRPRPMNADWVRSIQRQCERANVPFFFKQWGGRNKKAAGRELDGREWNGMPAKLHLPLAPAP